jgi:hypothetical protein
MMHMMKRAACRLMGWIIFASLAFAMALGQAKPADTTGGGTSLVSLEVKKPNMTGPAPRTRDGKTDFTGLWGPDRNFIYDISSALKPGDTLPLQPWAAKIAQERMSKDDPEANCLPAGVPRMAPYPWKIVQTPSLIVFLYEGNIHSYRQVFMDGRGHPQEPEPTWYGDSIGKWEGNTLVVDTVGFNDKFWFDFAAHPHTEKLHVIERYRRPDLGHLDFDVTIDDPGAYTRPFTLYGHSTLLTDTEIIEYVCNENNKDVIHIVGKDARK